MFAYVRMVGKAIVHIVFNDSKWTLQIGFQDSLGMVGLSVPMCEAFGCSSECAIIQHTQIMYDIPKQNLFISGTCYLQSPASSSGHAKERHPPMAMQPALRLRSRLILATNHLIGAAPHLTEQCYAEYANPEFCRSVKICQHVKFSRMALAAAGSPSCESSIFSLISWLVASQSSV